MEGAPPVANQIGLFMHFLGGSRDGLVARPVEMDKLSSSVLCLWVFVIYLTIDSEQDQEVLCIQLRNQQTCILNNYN
jgi:hypothetical protein